MICHHDFHHDLSLYISVTLYPQVREEQIDQRKYGWEDVPGR